MTNDCIDIITVSSKVEIKKLGGVAALIKLLDLPDPDVKKNASIAISSLLEDCKTRNSPRRDANSEI